MDILQILDGWCRSSMDSSTSLHQAQTIGAFRGDDEGLVDVLIEVCAQQQAGIIKNRDPNLHKLIGRELQPFCFDDAPALNSTPSPTAKSRYGMHDAKYAVGLCFFTLVPAVGFRTTKGKRQILRQHGTLFHTLYSAFMYMQVIK